MRLGYLVLAVEDADGGPFGERGCGLSGHGLPPLSSGESDIHQDTRGLRHCLRSARRGVDRYAERPGRERFRRRRCWWTFCGVFWVATRHRRRRRFGTGAARVARTPGRVTTSRPTRNRTLTVTRCARASGIQHPRSTPPRNLPSLQLELEIEVGGRYSRGGRFDGMWNLSSGMRCLGIQGPRARRVVGVAPKRSHASVKMM